MGRRNERQEVFALGWKAGLSPNVGSAKGAGRERERSRPFNFHNSRALACAAESPKLSPGAF